MTIILAILIAFTLGVALGCWALARSINWMLSKGIMDIFYHGQRSDEFRLW